MEVYLQITPINFLLNRLQIKHSIFTFLCFRSDKSSKSTKSAKSEKSVKKKVKTEEPPEVVVESQEELERRLLKCALSVFPKHSVTIAPNKTAEFIINYTPTQRMKQFMEKICMQIGDSVQPICMVKGYCLGMEFSLDRSLIPFGAVVRNCEKQSKLLLINSGDIGAK